MLGQRQRGEKGLDPSLHGAGSMPPGAGLPLSAKHCPFAPEVIWKCFPSCPLLARLLFVASAFFLVTLSVTSACLLVPLPSAETVSTKLRS